MITRASIPPEDDDEGSPSAELQAIFGESLRLQRMKAGLTQAELAARSGINQETISRIEKGRYNLTLRTMSRLAALLDGDVADMLRRGKNNS
jgi:transcriptional regulator with XRE-family HTH domain